MISIVKLSKNYQKEVLKDIDLNLPDKGMIGICGPSGCGKTTLLNCLTGLTEYSGIIEIDDMNLSNLNEKETDEYRLKNMGLVFQDFRLFENLSIYENVILPLDSSIDLDKKLKKRRCLDILQIVGIDKKKKEYVRNLSGGEKQRVGIARAIIHDPKIVIADEPTASLDIKNSIEIMKILKKISKYSLVIVVSHDKSLLSQFVDKIIYMKDGQIANQKDFNNPQIDNNYLVCGIEGKVHKGRMKTSFLSRYTNSVIKHKRWRTLICNFVTSMGLVGVGLASTIETIVSKNIKSAYSSIVDESTITIALKDYDRGVNKISAANEDDLNTLVNDYKNEIVDYGYTYHVDYENFFIDENNFTFGAWGYNYQIKGLSTRHINEYIWLDEVEEKVLPNDVIEMNDDEIVCGLTFQNIKDICYRLRIIQNVESFSDYLSKNEFYITLNVRNDNWDFFKDHQFKLKGFIFSKTPCIYHLNHRWNKYIFEDVFSLPIKSSFAYEKYPYELTRIPYIKPKDRNGFLELTRKDVLMDENVFEIANSSYYPTLYRNKEMSQRNRLLFLHTESKYIPPRFTTYFKECCEHLDDENYANNASYNIYPSNMMSGFARLSFLSTDQELLETVENNNDKIRLEENEYFVLPNEVVSGYFAKNEKNNLRFSAVSSKNSYNSIYDIGISSSLAHRFFKGENPIGKKLIFGSAVEEHVNENNIISRRFVNTQLNVVDVIDSSDFNIYQKADWVINFYQCELGFSIFDLLPNIISLKTNQIRMIDEDVEILKKAFPTYVVLNPFKNINDSIKSVCSFLKIILLVLSIMSMIISLLLLSISNYLHILENHKDIALMRCIGINKKETKKFIFFHSGYLCLYSMIIALFEMVMISFVLSFSFSKNMGSSFVFTQSITSYLLIIGFAFMIWLLSSFTIASKKVKTI